MKFLMSVFFLLVPFSLYAAEGGVDAFFGKYYWAFGLAFAVWEYLVGVSKLKANSTVEMIVDFLKKFNPKK